MDKRKVKTAFITDLDNTLFDWFDIWHKSFSAMLDELVRLSGHSESALIKETKAVHQFHGTSEYAFLIEELPSLQSEKENVRQKYDEAIQAFRRARETALSLYPDVAETLETIKDSGAIIVGYTESMAYYTSYRIKRLGLDGTLDYIYSPADHDIPLNIQRDRKDLFQAEYQNLSSTIHRNTPAGEIKPNPKILLDIISDMGVNRHQAVYLGDSLFKDVRMAQSAGVDDVLAGYGEAHSRSEYDLLRSVTHWSDEQVQIEKSLTQKDVSPSIVLTESIGEILDHFIFDRAMKDERY